MASATASFAQSLGITHRTTPIPWEEPPFPSVPPAGTPFESLARRARYHLLLLSILRDNVDVLCTGHHLDDQVETAIMRLDKNSSTLGLAGMRSLRRWGMGDERAYMGKFGLGWAGVWGMNKWIARPLLGVSKVSAFASLHQ